MTTSEHIPAVEIAVRTDPGRDPEKQVNEDSSAYEETPLGLLAVVCDGMGGHAGGREASQLAIATIVEVVRAAPPATSAGVALKRAIEEANARVWNMPTAEAGYRPGSTVVAVLVHEGGAEIAHVGDSRIYFVHAGAITQVTRDHSIVQELVARKLIRAEEAATHPDANKILRALGIAKDVEVELRPEPISYVAGDVLVLCSDGLSDLVEPAELLEVAGTQPAAQAAGQLVDLANARGGHDNITAMVVRLKSTAIAREAADPARRGVAKTIPLTVQVAPTEPGAGPTGTVVSAPALGSGAAPAGGTPVGPASGDARIPPAPPVAAVDGGGRPRTAIVVLGVVLAIVAVAIVAAVAYMATRPRQHRVVPVVVDDRQRPALLEAGAPDEDDGGDVAAEPTIAPAPPLDPEPTARWRGRDGGHSDPCGALERLRERDASADILQRLEDRCREQGGVP